MLFLEIFIFRQFLRWLWPPKSQKKSIFPKSPKITQNDPLGLFSPEIHVFGFENTIKQHFWAQNRALSGWEKNLTPSKFFSAWEVILAYCELTNVLYQREKPSVVLPYRQHGALGPKCPGDRGLCCPIGITRKGRHGGLENLLKHLYLANKTYPRSYMPSCMASELIGECESLTL